MPHLTRTPQIKIYVINLRASRMSFCFLVILPSISIICSFSSSRNILSMGYFLLSPDSDVILLMDSLTISEMKRINTMPLMVDGFLSLSGNMYKSIFRISKCSVFLTSGQIEEIIMRQFLPFHLHFSFPYFFSSLIFLPSRSLPPLLQAECLVLPCNTVLV